MTLESCLMTLLEWTSLGRATKIIYFNGLPTLRNRVGQPFLHISPTLTRSKPAGERGSELNSSYGSKVQNLLSEKGDVQRFYGKCETSM